MNIFRRARDLGAEPLFVINCGMSHKENVPMSELGPWIQDALDAIEYANGPADGRSQATDTMKPQNGGWGAVRARNGHPAPFHLKYMEIGNENGGPAYAERYAAFYKAIKAKYPDIHLIADEWSGVPKSAPVEIVDEHYYNSPGFFIQNATRYDSYDRSGPRVYVGEYAVTQNCGRGNLKAALGEAAFMTGLERNSDVVVMASYAPLFANLNHKTWNPDLICFDSSTVYGTPSYYVQQMFGKNRGDVVLPVELDVASAPEEPRHGAVGVGTWETQAEYKDIRVAQGDKVLFTSDSPADISGWRVFSGQWQAKEGALQQTAGGIDHRLLAGDPAWRDYTLSLKARKLGGAEGFLVLFHVQDDNNWLWWNLGGWGNSRHAIERCVDGGKSILGRGLPGRIETGRWYDVRIDVEGQSIRCYLDGKLTEEATDSRDWQPLYAVAGRSQDKNEIILKTVNVTDTPYAADIRLQGVAKVESSATSVVLTSANPADENSLDAPLKVAPVRQVIQNVSPRFHHTFPANSLTVLRLNAQ